MQLNTIHIVSINTHHGEPQGSHSLECADVAAAVPMYQMECEALFISARSLDHNTSGTSSSVASAACSRSAGSSFISESAVSNEM